MRHWVFSKADGRLTSEDRVATLTPKAGAVLACLLSRRGEVVSQGDILREVWGGIHVTPDLVREYVHDVRTALEDSAAAPDYIETVRGRGFRLVGDVREAPPAAVAQRASVAILRPAVFGEGQRWRHLADAIAEDITTDLARFPDFDVIARQSAFAVDAGQDIVAAARALGASYLLESSIAVAADTLRCTFQLVSGTTNAHVWAERRTWPLDDLPRISEATAALVANALGGWSGALHAAERARARRKPMADRTAYEHYLLALHHEQSWDAESHRLAIAHGEKAAALDPLHAQTLLILFYCYLRAVDMPGWDAASCQQRALAAITKAHELDPRDAKILCETAFAAAAGGRMAGVADILSRAADLGRNQADTQAILANAHVALVDEPHEARRLLDAAHRLNPFPPDWYRLTDCRVSFYGRDFARAVDMADGLGADIAPATLYRSLAIAMIGDERDVARAREDLDRRLPGYDFDAHVSAFPIVAPEALRLFRTAVSRLVET